MRNITDHIVEGDSANHQLKIQVMDDPGQGGACHQYQIIHPGQLDDNNQHIAGSGHLSVAINFQNGPIKEFGVNGLTHEALLAILMDRLRSFQSGPFACEANAVALGHCEHALAHLQLRTRERIKRGVEGTHEK